MRALPRPEISKVGAESLARGLRQVAFLARRGGLMRKSGGDLLRLSGRYFMSALSRSGELAQFRHLWPPGACLCLGHALAGCGCWAAHGFFIKAPLALQSWVLVIW